MTTTDCHGACCYCTDCKHEIDECVCGRFKMKEQVNAGRSVDCFCSKCVAGKDIKLPSGCLCRCHRNRLKENMCGQCGCLNNTGEYERLQQIEINIKRMLEDLDKNISQELAACQEVTLMKNIKKLLEALIK
jgi:hypothetical protein